MMKDFSQKIAVVIEDFTNSPLEMKTEILTNLRQTIRKNKSKAAKQTLRFLESFFKEVIQDEIRVS